jgi:hypothetical protein
MPGSLLNRVRAFAVSRHGEVSADYETYTTIGELLDVDEGLPQECILWLVRSHVGARHIFDLGTPGTYLFEILSPREPESEG